MRSEPIQMTVIDEAWLGCVQLDAGALIFLCEPCGFDMPLAKNAL